jgi:hypothetical protein
MGSLGACLRGPGVTLTSLSTLHLRLSLTGLDTDSQRGPPDTPYAGGEYHGLIWFPSDYRTSDDQRILNRTT